VKTCDRCKRPAGWHKRGPADGWQIEGGGTLCHACCVEDLKQFAGLIVADYRSKSMRPSDGMTFTHEG
jgi:hypothetical protein